MISKQQLIPNEAWNEDFLCTQRLPTTASEVWLYDVIIRVPLKVSVIGHVQQGVLESYNREYYRATGARAKIIPDVSHQAPCRTIAGLCHSSTDNPLDSQQRFG
jgi:hypothetical protein